MNDINPASLILGKVYRRLPDPEAHDMLRVIDEDKSEPVCNVEFYDFLYNILKKL